MEDASSSATPNNNGQQQCAQPHTEDTAFTQQQRHLRYKYDAGDAVILHGLIQNTNVNGRRGVVHYSSSADYDGLPGVGANNVANNVANNANDTANNGNVNGNTNAAADADDDNRRCMIRLLPLEKKRSNSNNNNNNGADDTAEEDETNNNSSRGGGGRFVISVKAKNLTLDYPPGQRVLLQGLVMAKHLNGRVAKIIGFRKGKSTERFLVEVPVCRNDEKAGAANRNDDPDRNGSLTVEEKLAMVAETNAKFDSDATSQLPSEEKGTTILSTATESANNSTRRDSFKQILVSPKNILHLPGQKPPAVPLLDQRLVFAGTMTSIVKLLNHSVHKANMTPSDVLDGNGFGLLSEQPPGMAPGSVMAEMSTSTRLWGKIQSRSYKCRGSSNAAAAAAADGNTNDPPMHHEEEDGNRLPPFYQRLVSSSPSLGRTHKVCFNPKCHAIIPPGNNHSRMKRCTKCHSVAYCHRECALQAWGHHRKVCRTMHEKEGVRFADFVTLNSPHREDVIETQRMVRRCVNRIARLDDSAGHFERMGQPHNNNRDDDDDDNNGDGSVNTANDAATAKLLYDTITQGGTDVANEILLHLENPPPVDREVTVAVGFNSLGYDAIFSPADIQLFANIYGCTVTYRVWNAKNVDDNDGCSTEKQQVEDVMVREPNGEEIHMPNQGGMPDDVQEGFLNFLNQMMPGAMMPPGMNNADNDAAHGADAGNDGGGGAAAAAAADNNGAAAAQVPHGMPPEIANFLNHVMNEAGVGGFGNGDNNNDNAAADDDDDDEDDEDDDNLDPLEDVADVAQNANNEQPPQQQHEQGGGGFHFNLPGGGEAHFHVAQVNVNDGGEGELPPGVPMMPPPGAFFQMPGMPAGVQVAMAQAGVDFPMPAGGGDGNDGGMMGGMPPMGAFQPIPGVPGGFRGAFHAMHAGPFPVVPGGDGAQANLGAQPGFAAAMMDAGVFGAHPELENRNAGNDEVEEETEMEIED